MTREAASRATASGRRRPDRLHFKGRRARNWIPFPPNPGRRSGGGRCIFPTRLRPGRPRELCSLRPDGEGPELPEGSAPSPLRPAAGGDSAPVPRPDSGAHAVRRGERSILGRDDAMGRHEEGVGAHSRGRAASRSRSAAQAAAARAPSSRLSGTTMGLAAGAQRRGSPASSPAPEVCARRPGATAWSPARQAGMHPAPAAPPPPPPRGPVPAPSQAPPPSPPLPRPRLRPRPFPGPRPPHFAPFPSRSLHPESLCHTLPSPPQPPPSRFTLVPPAPAPPAAPNPEAASPHLLASQRE